MEEEAELTITQQRLAYVDRKAARLIEAAGLEGAAAESLRQAVHSNHGPILQQFAENGRMAKPAAS